MARDRVWIETTPTRESFLSSPSAGEGERRPTVKNCGRRKNCTVVDLDFRARGRTPPASAQEIDADKKRHVYSTTKTHGSQKFAATFVSMLLYQGEKVIFSLRFLFLFCVPQATNVTFEECQCSKRER